MNFCCPSNAPVDCVLCTISASSNCDSYTTASTTVSTAVSTTASTTASAGTIVSTTANTDEISFSATKTVIASGLVASLAALIFL